MFRDMTGNTKFARCEGCGEPIFDRWDFLSSYLSSRSAMTIFLRQFSTSLIRFVMRLSDSSWHEDCLFCSQVSHICLWVVFGGSSTVALSQKSIPGQGHVILGVKQIFTFYGILNLGVKKSKTRPDIFTLIYSWHILKITWQCFAPPFLSPLFSVTCQVWYISWQS